MRLLTDENWRTKEDLARLGYSHLIIRYYMMDAKLMYLNVKTGESFVFKEFPLPSLNNRTKPFQTIWYLTDEEAIDMVVPRII